MTTQGTSNFSVFDKTIEVSSNKKEITLQFDCVAETKRVRNLIDNGYERKVETSYFPEKK